MKKLTGVMIALLICWNALLTYAYYYKSNTTGIIANRPIVDHSVSRITSDLTKLIAICEPQVVGISTYRNNDLTSTGSGVIYQVSGEEVLIVTNNHVIEYGNNFKIRFANGEQREAFRIGADILTDIAVLSVNTDFEVKPFKIGDSALTTVGEYVVAIGSPLGLEFQGTATFGIISGKDRVIPIDLSNNGIPDWDSIVLQTDAAINPGNSGGALVNLAGELIGITSMKISSYDVEGMGFAIPINEIVSIVEQIKEYGVVKRPLLGVSGIGVSSMSNMEKNYYNIDLSLNSGIYISNVAEKSAAEKAGIKIGDIITKMDNVIITDYKQFRVELYKKSINQKITIEVLRDNQKRTFEAILAST